MVTGKKSLTNIDATEEVALGDHTQDSIISSDLYEIRSRGDVLRPNYANTSRKIVSFTKASAEITFSPSAPTYVLTYDTEHAKWTLSNSGFTVDFGEGDADCGKIYTNAALTDSGTFAFVADSSSGGTVSIGSAVVEVTEGQERVGDVVVDPGNIGNGSIVKMGSDHKISAATANEDYLSPPSTQGVTGRVVMIKQSATDNPEWNDFHEYVRPWTASTSYGVNQHVIYNGTVFVCITANSDATFDSSKWVAYGKTFTATGIATPVSPNASGQVDLSSLFSSANTSLISTINGVVAAPNATLTAALGSDS